MKADTSSPNDYRELRKIVILVSLITIMLAILSQGCQEACDKPTYTYFEPIYAPLSEVRVIADYITPQPIESPGKLYFKDDHIFVSETNKGIHVIDNKNPRQPTKVGFIDLPGNKDLAAKGNFLYADNYMDLVILDISDKTNVEEINRIEDVFSQYYYHDSELGVIVDYHMIEMEYDVECGEEMFFAEEFIFQDVAAFSASASSGIGGSMARFTIASEYLYTVNEYEMKLFDISILDSPIQGNIVDLGWGIETIFPYGNNLFLGARTGMHIYDNSNPELPEYVSTYAHVNTCDPVVVQGDLAYVTLRSGTECETFTNQLDIINIEDLQNPKLVATHEMTNPHGLGIDGDCLFIAEGAYGLKLFNAEDPYQIHDNLIKHHKNVHAFDVIPLGEILLMVGENGFYQYGYDCEDQLELLSSIGF